MTFKKERGLKKNCFLTTKKKIKGPALPGVAPPLGKDAAEQRGVQHIVLKQKKLMMMMMMMMMRIRTMMMVMMVILIMMMMMMIVMIMRG